MTAPRDPELTRTLEDALTRTIRTFRRMVVEEAEARGLTQAQHSALRHMVEAGELRMSELACHLGLTNSATTGLVERLDGRGLVARRPDPEDGRVVRVDVTPAGRAVYDELKAIVMGKLGEAFDRMPEAVRYMAVGGVVALAEALEPGRQDG